MKIDGIRFPILILSLIKKFNPIASIRSPPTADISFTTGSVSKSLANPAIKTMEPW